MSFLQPCKVKMAPKRPRKAKKLLNIAIFLILGALGGCLGPILEGLGGVLEALGGVLEACGSVLEALGGVLEALEGVLKPSRITERIAPPKPTERDFTPAVTGGWRQWRAWSIFLLEEEHY